MSISNTQKFIAYIRELIAKDDFKTAIQQLSALLKDSPLLDEAVQQSARYNNVLKQIRLGLVDFQTANIAQNQILNGILELLREIEEQEQTQPSIKAEVERYAVKNSVNQSTINAGGNAIIGDGNTINYFTSDEATRNKPVNNRKWLKIGASVVAAIGLIASIAQISGYSFKDFMPKDEKPTVVALPPVVLPKKDTIYGAPPKEKSNVSVPKNHKPVEQPTTKNHFESHDQSKQINVPDNKGTININQ